jgi:S1-C subfamily serine protease
VFATGNPFFLALDGRSVSTLGVVSGLNRVLGNARDHLYGNAIQHDAAVNPGNSGGPLGT